MTDTQVKHLNKIAEEAHTLLVQKYVRGAEEHKSSLSEDYTALELLDEAINEAVDQMVYLLTLKEKLNERS